MSGQEKDGTMGTKKESLLVSWHASRRMNSAPGEAAIAGMLIVAYGTAHEAVFALDERPKTNFWLTVSRHLAQARSEEELESIDGFQKEWETSS